MAYPDDGTYLFLKDESLGSSVRSHEIEDSIFFSN